MHRARLALVLLAATAACDGDAELTIDTTYSQMPALPIPDTGMLSSTIEVAATGNVMQATVEVIVEHARPADLTLVVMSPAGTTAEIGGRIAEGSDQYRYAIPLLAFQGEAANGTWTLTVTDGAAQESGTLLAWAVELPGV
ncbi:MAG: proprotein convertase P-domain-containing protein [Deltaproteobacteria bacterium]|jgi:subtilisin-like proprotein convertase family protein